MTSIAVHRPGRTGVLDGRRPGQSASLLVKIVVALLIVAGALTVADGSGGINTATMSSTAIAGAETESPTPPQHRSAAERRTRLKAHQRQAGCIRQAYRLALDPAHCRTE